LATSDPHAAAALAATEPLRPSAPPPLRRHQANKIFLSKGRQRVHDSYLRGSAVRASTTSSPCLPPPPLLLRHIPHSLAHSNNVNNNIFVSNYYANIINFYNDNKNKNCNNNKHKNDINNNYYSDNNNSNNNINNNMNNNNIIII
jgi:hypothetical protein